MYSANIKVKLDGTKDTILQQTQQHQQQIKRRKQRQQRAHNIIQIHHKSQIPILSKADRTLIKAKSKTSTPNDKHTPINTPSNKTISTVTPTTAFQRTNTKNNKKTEKDTTKEKDYTPQQIQE